MEQNMKAIETLIAAAAKANDGGEAMRFSQAAVNAANATLVLAQIKRDEDRLGRTPPRAPSR